MSPAVSSLPVASEGSTQIDRALVSAFLENIPDYVFFKDLRSRYIAISKSVVRNFSGATTSQIIGRTDFDFFSGGHARATYDDEQYILRTSESILNKVEREIWTNGRITWALTSRMPLRNEDGIMIGTFGMSRDITKTRELEFALEKANRELVDASRAAGMAEVANGVLHNVGNVLNSLNVSASVIATGLRQSKAASLVKLAQLLRAQDKNLGAFLTTDPKGKRVPEFLASLTQHAVAERARLLEEVAALQKNIDHIKEFVSMQQAYATTVAVVEPLDPVALMEDSVRMNAGGLLRHEVTIEREFQPTPPILAEKGKVVQILVNLIRNAKNACDESGQPERRMTLRIKPGATADRIQLTVQDNGVGIPWLNLDRIFGHGFTTRPNGHGFGLHSSANAAREMKGSLTVHSDGVGQGATFTLELPAAPATPSP